MQYRFLLAGLLILAAIPFSESSLLPAAELYPQNISFHFARQATPFWEQGKPKDISTDTAALKLSNWYAQAMKGIEEMEYEIKYDEATKSYASPNRKNNLRSFYTANTFTLLPRNDSIDKWELELKTLGVFVNNKLVYSPAQDAGVSLHQKTIRFNNENNFNTEYINSPEGVRQNFIINKEPENQNSKDKIQKNKLQTLNLKLQTNKDWFVNKVHDKELHFAKATKTGYDKKITYNGLKVWDANNKELVASFSVKNDIVSIDVNTKGAVYPVTIDPLSTTASTQLEINQTNAFLGYSVASAGDVNGDGYSDVIVGAYLYSNPAPPFQPGAAFIFHGSATGIGTTVQAYLKCDQTGQSNFGISVASAGDVNKDGYSDVIVGARDYTNGQSQEGGAFVFLGSAVGVNTTIQAQLEVNQSLASMGWSVASAGDVNGDGYSDVIVGATAFDNGELNEGGAFVYHGSASGIIPTIQTQLESNQNSANMGSSVACAGDVNGDGYSDVIVGVWSFGNGQGLEGAAFIYHGSSTGITTTIQTQLESNQFAARMGVSVSSAGDVNGDGYSDVIVGAYGYENGQNGEGAAFVYHGSATGITTTIQAQLEVNQVDAEYGNSVASTGDVNGDGYSDVIVGAFQYDNGQSNEGAAFVYFGSATGITNIIQAQLESNQIDAQFGNSVTSAGDVNGDGYSDVIAGAPNYDNGNPNEGAAFLYHGSAGGINTSTAAMVESNQASGYMGISVASAGDVNGDGYSDIIVGAHYYDNGQTDEGAAFVYHGSATGISTTAAAMVESNQASAYMGRSVASAGDVNGDGYSDVIVGAIGYDNGQTDEGAAFVYHGSATGISTAAAAIVESNQATVNMGISVASAGDVNGDGYSDVIVGGFWYDNGESNEGAAFIYHGSASGISTTAAAITESNQIDAWMGYSVSSAGDVNGDGYCDVIVGAYNYDNGQTDEGAAFLYHGSATGISTTAAAIVESNQASANMGISVASAGDVNGDGYSDVIVGAYNYDNGQTDEGAAFLYHGSATGISTTAAVFTESNQADAKMGNSVASAGDVNGDGYSDVVVGAYRYDNGQTDEGAAFMYHGSATGISSTAIDVVESNQANAYMGVSVASAGDVNADGYSDVIVGVYFYDNGQTDEGAAFIYHGNNGGGKRNNLRLYNQDLVTPISHFNVTEPNLFGTGLFAKSPLGKVKGKLVWEVKSESGKFSGNPITNSTAFLGKQPSWTDLGIAGTELKYNVQKVGSKTNKVRVRVEYDKVTAITGQVYGPWRYPAGYTMGAYGMFSIPLPITLISFNGQFINSSDVQLSWITTNEINMQSYFIERSVDGINFISVAEQNARGVGSNRVDYTNTDKNVQHDVLYYRLRLKEKSGEISYTKTITISRKKLIKNFIAPNPVAQGKDAVLVLQSSDNNVSTRINIYNASGQLISSENKILKSGRNDISIATSALNKGGYIIQVIGDGIKENFKLLVQ